MEEMKKGEPISPDKVQEVEDIIPPEVFDCFNEEILSNFKKGESRVSYIDVVKKITDKLGNCLGKWLNIEDAYRAKGWQVTYDPAPYSCEPFFIFVKN